MPASLEAHVLDVGDPRRLLIRRAIIGTLLAAAFFSVTTGPVKQVKLLYDHAPWANDPYDTAVSFAMFFVPLLAVCCLARVLLCRRAEPLPVQRVIDLLRGCGVVLGLIVITGLAEWVALATGANRAQWNGAAWLQIGFLAVTTILTAVAIAGVRHVPVRGLGTAAVTGLADPADPAGPAEPVDPADPAEPAGLAEPAAGDWLADAIAVFDEQIRRLGPFASRPARSVLAWIDRRLAAPVRRHPLWAAGAVAAAFGIVVGGVQAIREGYVAGPALLTVTLLSCGMFAFLVGAGGYLGLVRARVTLTGVARRILDASVITCASLLAVLAFRNSLWWIVGSNATAARLPAFELLLGIAALTVFAVVLVLETLLRSHPGPAP